MKKTVWTFGLIAGAVLSVMMWLTIPFMDHTDRAEIVGYTTMVAAFLLVFFGIRAYRDGVATGTVSFGRAFGVGLLIVLIASVCYTLSWQVLSRKFYPDFVTKYRDAQITQIRASGKPQAEVDKAVADANRFAEMYKNPVVNFALTMLEPLPVGIVIALVSAGVLSRRKRSAMGYVAAASS